MTSLAETADGRYLISLKASAASASPRNSPSQTPFRQCRIMPFAADLIEDAGAAEVDRKALLKAFRQYLEANELEADWESVSRADNATLVNALSMMAPYGPPRSRRCWRPPTSRRGPRR